MKVSESLGNTCTVVYGRTRQTNITFAQGLTVVRFRIWWRSMTTNEKVVACILIGAGSVLVKK